MKCKHENSMLEMEQIIDYSTEDFVELLFKDICSDCGKLLGKEIQTFKFVSSKEVKGGIE